MKKKKRKSKEKERKKTENVKKWTFRENSKKKTGKEWQNFQTNGGKSTKMGGMKKQ